MNRPATRAAALVLFAQAALATACDQPAEQGNVAGAVADDGVDLDTGTPHGFRRGDHEVELDGETRLVSVRTLRGHDRAVTVHDVDGTLLAAAWTDGEDVVELGFPPAHLHALAAGDAAAPGLCIDDACDHDPVTAEILAVATSDVSGDDARDDDDSDDDESLLPWCSSLCNLAWDPDAQTDQLASCLHACDGVFCPVGRS